MKIGGFLLHMSCYIYNVKINEAGKRNRPLYHLEAVIKAVMGTVTVDDPDAGTIHRPTATSDP
jgi:hypothetical protein